MKMNENVKMYIEMTVHIMIRVHIIFRSAQNLNHFFLGPFSSITPGFVEIHTVFIVLITNKPTNRQRWKLGNYMSV